MAEIVHVALYDTLADWEVGYATAHVNNPEYQREPGRYQVVWVGADDQPRTTIGGMRITPDTTLSEMGDSAMLILPGAGAWDEGGNTAFVDKARELLDRGTPVAAICGATMGLARAGLLDDRRHTSNALEYLRFSGYGGEEHYVDAPAVEDRDVITASAMAPVDFARQVLERLDVYEPHVLAAWHRLHAHRDPSAFHELNAA